MKKMVWVKVGVWALSLAPLGWLLYGAWQEKLGANPIEYVTHATGDWTLRFLLLTLAVTPARRLTGVGELIRLRRLLGMFAFFYGVLHLVTYVWFDKFFDTAEMWKDVAKRPYITMGVAAFSVMVPLAVTSTAGWIRRLKGKNWQRLHRLVYLSALGGVVHYYWLVKADVRLPVAYGVVAVGLLGMRLWRPAGR